MSSCEFLQPGPRWIRRPCMHGALTTGPPSPLSPHLPSPPSSLPVSYLPANTALKKTRQETQDEDEDEDGDDDAALKNYHHRRRRRRGRYVASTPATAPSDSSPSPPTSPSAAGRPPTSSSPKAASSSSAAAASSTTSSTPSSTSSLTAPSSSSPTPEPSSSTHLLAGIAPSAASRTSPTASRGTTPAPGPPSSSPSAPPPARKPRLPEARSSPQLSPAGGSFWRTPTRSGPLRKCRCRASWATWCSYRRVDVIVLNGAGAGTTGWELAREAVLNPVLYRPDEPVGRWFVVLNPKGIPRLYHSSASLDFYGKVTVGGSNSHMGYVFAGVEFLTELSLEAFLPPYLDVLYDGRRPRKLEAPSEVRYGGAETVRFEVEDGVQEGVVAAVAPGFATHAVGMNQSVVVLGLRRMEKVGEMGYVAEVAPPGYYVWFVVHDRVPSQAVWVQIG